MITSRTHLLTHQQDENRHVLGVADPPTATAWTRPAPCCCTCCRSIRRGSERLSRLLPPAEAEEAIGLVESIYNLANLATRPVLLAIMAAGVGRLRQARQPGASDVYEQFAQEWLERAARSTAC